MNTRRITFRVMTCWIVLSVPSLVRAQVSWTNPGTGDWFDAANWNTPNIPSSANDTLVNNGGTAEADRSSPLYAADPATNDLNVGVRTSPALPAPIATGTVELTDVNLAASGSLNVGVINTPVGLFHNATGVLRSLAGSNAVGDVSVNGVVAVGQVVVGPAGATATGTVGLSGNLTGGDTDDVIVGETADAAAANGTVDITGNVSGFLGIVVGHTGPQGTGAAGGTLRLDGGTVTADTMSVGVSEGAGPATGTVELNETLVDLDSNLTFGAGSHLIVHIDGPNRGSEYGAIDASTANLGGVLDVFFEYLPPLGTHHFDLIRAADSASAISGDFGAGGVTVSGLPDLYMVSTGIVVDMINGQPIAVYRLNVNAVPERASGLLLVLGITSGVLQRRGRATRLK